MPAPTQKFFVYSQNNSGGETIIDENTDEFVIIEAITPDESHEIATKIGLYDHWWCDCCGPRFEGPWSDSDFKTFEQLDAALAYCLSLMFEHDAGCIVHFKDGTKLRVPHSGPKTPPAH